VNKNLFNASNGEHIESVLRYYIALNENDNNIEQIIRFRYELKKINEGLRSLRTILNNAQLSVNKVNTKINEVKERMNKRLSKTELNNARAELEQLTKQLATANATLSQVKVDLNKQLENGSIVVDKFRNSLSVFLSSKGFSVTNLVSSVDLKNIMLN